ncbi:MAG: elongation factor P [Candidatus Omnitrophica bacterium]|jgi:elongation factor P|nr:elongation factor P [Candidatus Omnitrophota bacterium]
MISANEFKNGVVIKYNNQLFQIVWFQHVKMQQRAPIVRAKLVSLKTGQLLEQPFRSGDTFEDVFLERHELQYLYSEGDLFHFMNNEDYQDVVINRAMIQEQLKYMKENMNVTGLYGDNELLTVELPASVVLEIKETEPGVRGDTAKSGSKPATLETGAAIKVPLFINPGDMVKVDTRTGAYIERA